MNYEQQEPPENVDLQVLPEGDYDATVEAVRKVKRFNREVIEFIFRIIVGHGPKHDPRLPGYCSCHKARRRHSKLASWQRAIADFTGGSANKVTMEDFKQYWYRIRVRTVKESWRQEELSKRDRYSVVQDIVQIVGKISEGT